MKRRKPSIGSCCLELPKHASELQETATDVAEFLVKVPAQLDGSGASGGSTSAGASHVLFRSTFFFLFSRFDWFTFAAGPAQSNALKVSTSDN